jgi:hypothetical protein
MKDIIYVRTTNGILTKLKETYFKMARGDILSADRVIDYGDYIIFYDIDKITVCLSSLIKPLTISLKCNYRDTEVDANNHVLMIFDMMKELALKNAINHINLIKEDKKNVDK